MADVIVRCLKLQLATWIVRIRSHVEHSTELRIAVSVGFDSPALPGTDHRPRFLDMNLQGVIGAEQFAQVCIQAMQLIQTRFAQ